jgi:hypothetical protein
MDRRDFLKMAGIGLVFITDPGRLAVAAENVAARAPAAGPEAIFFNGKIVSLDAAGTTAGAVAVQDGKVLKIGSVEEIKKLAGPSTRLVDLGGKTVVPGLIDAHCHPMETIYLKEAWADCRYPQTKSVDPGGGRRRPGRRRQSRNPAEWFRAIRKDLANPGRGALPDGGTAEGGHWESPCRGWR